MKKIIVVFFILTYCHINAPSQQVVSSGGYEVKSGITVDWMLGGSLSDIPVNDPASLQKSSEGKQASEVVKFKIYPIPANDFINIESGIADTIRLSFDLYNNSGTLIFNKTLTNLPYIQISLNNIPAGTYLLKISMTEPGQPFWVKKIIKN